jgi:hypothetical protein
MSSNQKEPTYEQKLAFIRKRFGNEIALLIESGSPLSERYYRLYRTPMGGEKSFPANAGDEEVI